MAHAGCRPLRTRWKNSAARSIRPRKRAARLSGVQRRRRASAANSLKLTSTTLGDLTFVAELVYKGLTRFRFQPRWFRRRGAFFFSLIFLILCDTLSKSDAFAQSDPVSKHQTPTEKSQFIVCWILRFICDALH